MSKEKGQLYICAKCGWGGAFGDMNVRAAQSSDALPDGFMSYSDACCPHCDSFDVYDERRMQGAPKRVKIRVGVIRIIQQYYGTDGLNGLKSMHAGESIMELLHYQGYKDATQ